MIRTVKHFDRGDHTLVVDTTSGERVVSKIPKGGAPGLIRKATNFARAATKHVAAGSPNATDAQVAARWSICQSNRCGLFRTTGFGSGTCLHKSCGCSLQAVGSESSIGPNKLRWADQACPKGLWSAVTPDGEKVK